jgi:hypothetical protein
MRESWTTGLELVEEIWTSRQDTLEREIELDYWIGHP